MEDGDTLQVLYGRRGFRVCGHLSAYFYTRDVILEVGSLGDRAEQAGLEPTTLRLTADTVVAASRCK